MSKVVLFIVGLALLTVSGHYFFSKGSWSIVVKPTPRTVESPAAAQAVLNTTNALAISAANTKAPDVTLPAVSAEAQPKSPAPPSESVPIPVVESPKINTADSLRFALESVVEESIEQDIWDEIDADIK